MYLTNSSCIAYLPLRMSKTWSLNISFNDWSSAGKLILLSTYSSKARGAASTYSQCCGENGKYVQTPKAVLHRMRNKVCWIGLSASPTMLAQRVRMRYPPMIHPYDVSSTHRIRDVAIFHRIRNGGPAKILAAPAIATRHVF